MLLTTIHTFNIFEDKGSIRMRCNVLLLMILALFTVVNAGSIVYNGVDVKIRIVLESGEPLINATVEVKPSLYTTMKWVNTTDENGTVVFHNIIPSSGTIFINITKYSIYENLLALRQVNIPEDYYIELRIPFKILVANLTVLDEYLQPVNGTYNLYYRNKMVVTGEIINGTIFINGREVYGCSQYLLIDTDSSTGYGEIQNKLDIMYKLVINGGYSLNIDDSLNKQIIIDQHPPQIIIGEFLVNTYPQLPYDRWISFNITVYDGINSDKVKLSLKITNLDDGKEIGYEESRYRIGDKIIYNISFHISLRKLENQILVIKVSAIDIENHESSLSFNYFINTTSESMKENTTTQGFTNTSQPDQRRNEYSNTSSRNPSDNFSVFNPPSIEAGDQLPFPLLYIVGFIVSASVIYLEVMYFKNHRG